MAAPSTSPRVSRRTILVMAAWRNRWLPLAILFLLLTFVGSIHLGYHYAVDAPVAALIAMICWFAARWLYRERGLPSANQEGFNLIEQPAAR